MECWKATRTGLDASSVQPEAHDIIHIYVIYTYYIIHMQFDGFINQLVDGGQTTYLDARSSCNSCNSGTELNTW